MTCNSKRRPANAAGRFRMGESPAGFTLLELLVVIVIIGFMAGIVTFSIGDSFQRQLEKEARRFQTVLLAAADEAVYKSTEIGIFLTEKSYAPLRYDKVANGWVLMVERPFQMYSLPEGMRMTYTIEGFSQTGEQYEEIELFADEDSPEEDALSEIRRSLEEAGVDLEAAGSLAQAIQLETVELVPQIYILSSGEQSAFSLNFTPFFEDLQMPGYQVVSDGFSMPRVINMGVLISNDALAGF